MKIFRRNIAVALSAVLLPALLNVAASPAFAAKTKCMIAAEEEANKVGAPGSDEWYAAYDFVYEYCQIGIQQCDDFGSGKVCYHPSV